MFRLQHANSVWSKVHTLTVHCKLGRFLHNDYIKIRADVQKHVQQNKPVVALESTIITHGMPFPQNLKTALHVEEIIKAEAVLPATIGIIDGQIVVGLDNDEIKYLAEKKKDLVKSSRRDLSYVLAKKLSGGTTVSSTMLAAKAADIPLFVTGGIGGVHRGASETFDISADLQELGNTNVAVVCAGVKSILDIGLTLEYLETQGVPVITYGSNKSFPSFFTPESKFNAPYNLNTIEEIGQVIYHQFSLNLQNGIVIGVPIPSQYAASGENIEQAIQEALNKARSQGIAGKNVTPFVLEEIAKVTNGMSLMSNIGLIENNAKVGAQIAKELSKLRGKRLNDSHAYIADNMPTFKVQSSGHHEDQHRKRPVIMGASVFDIKATASSVDTVAEATNSGKLHLSIGGVGRNIAECLTKLGSNPLLISSVGKDYQGELILNKMKEINMDVSGINISSSFPTATYSVMADCSSGELIMAVGDMDINESISPEQVLQHESAFQSASIFIADANAPTETIHCAMNLCAKHNTPVWFEPTCVSKAAKPFLNKRSPRISFASPNVVELKAMAETITGTTVDTNLDEILSTDGDALCRLCLSLVEPCLPYIDNLIVTLGKQGVLVVCGADVKASVGNRMAKFFPPASEHLLPVRVKSVSGAGDSFAAGMIFGILQDYPIDISVKAGLFSAFQSLHSHTAVSELMNNTSCTYQHVESWADFSPRVLTF